MKSGRFGRPEQGPPPEFPSELELWQVAAIDDARDEYIRTRGVEP